MILQLRVSANTSAPFFPHLKSAYLTAWKLFELFSCTVRSNETRDFCSNKNWVSTKGTDSGNTEFYNNTDKLFNVDQPHHCRSQIHLIKVSIDTEVRICCPSHHPLCLWILILHFSNHKSLLPSVVRETKLQLPVIHGAHILLFRLYGSYCPQLSFQRKESQVWLRFILVYRETRWILMTPA